MARGVNDHANIILYELWASLKFNILQEDISIQLCSDKPYYLRRTMPLLGIFILWDGRNAGPVCK